MEPESKADSSHVPAVSTNIIAETLGIPPAQMRALFHEGRLVGVRHGTRRYLRTDGVPLLARLDSPLLQVHAALLKLWSSLVFERSAKTPAKMLQRCHSAIIRPATRAVITQHLNSPRYKDELPPWCDIDAAMRGCTTRVPFGTGVMNADVHRPEHQPAQPPAQPSAAAAQILNSLFQQAREALGENVVETQTHRANGAKARHPRRPATPRKPARTKSAPQAPLRRDGDGQDGDRPRREPPAPA